MSDTSGLTESSRALCGDGVVRVDTADPGRAEAFLPAPEAQSHAANLSLLPDGSLGCAWFAGTQEGLPDVNVWFSKLDSHGVWSEPVRVSDDPERSEQNPVLFPAPSGELYLFHTAQRGGRQDSAEIRVRRSADNGSTWGPVRTLESAAGSGGVYVRQPLIELPDERWLLPVFHCVRPARGKWVGDHDTSAVLISDDAGSSWEHVAVPGSTGCVHMNIVPLADGTLLALYRRRQADFLFQSLSSDGVRWTEPEPTELPNNNSSIQATALRDGSLALVFNASSAADASGRRLSLYDDIGECADGGIGEHLGPEHSQVAGDANAGAAFWGAPRAPLRLALSTDNGQSWPHWRDLEVGDGDCMTNNSVDGLNREYSYPSIVQGRDGDLHIAYTYFRQAIKYTRIAPGWAM